MTLHAPRRRILTGLLAAPFVLSAAARAQGTLPEQTTIPDALKGTGEVRVATYGGSMQESQRVAYFEPFEKISGIRVRHFPGASGVRAKAMVDTGNVEWDLVQLSRGTVLNLEKQGNYFEPIDYDIVDAGVGPEFRFEKGLEMLIWAQVLAYRTDAFRGAVPNGWTDFWDTRKFPGDRALVGATGGNVPELEFALMAAGVPPEKVYPIDMDKAFASYDRIKRSVVKWWETGAVPTQLLTDREVTMTSVWNGRMAAIQQAGVPAAVSWNQGLLKRDAWAIPKGARNRTQAMKLAAYSTMAIPMARLAMLIPYGSVNSGSDQYIPAARQEVLPSAPAIKSQLLSYDYMWWVDHRDAVTARFNRWLLS